MATPPAQIRVVRTLAPLNPAGSAATGVVPPDGGAIMGGPMKMDVSSLLGGLRSVAPAESVVQSLAPEQSGDAWAGFENGGNLSSPFDTRFIPAATPMLTNEQILRQAVEQANAGYKPLPFAAPSVEAPNYGTAPVFNSGELNRQVDSAQQEGGILSLLGALMGSAGAGVTGGARYASGKTEAAKKTLDDMFGRDAQSFNANVSMQDRAYDNALNQERIKAESTQRYNAAQADTRDSAIKNATDIYRIKSGEDLANAKLEEDKRKNKAKEMQGEVRMYLSQLNNARLDPKGQEAISNKLQGLGLEDFPPQFLATLTPYEQRKLEELSLDRASREAMATERIEAAKTRNDDTQAWITARQGVALNAQKDLAQTRGTIQKEIARLRDAGMDRRANASAQNAANRAQFSAATRALIASQGGVKGASDHYNKLSARLNTLSSSLTSELRGTDGVKKQISDLYKNANLIDTGDPTLLNPQGQKLLADLNKQYDAHTKRLTSIEDEYNAIKQEMANPVVPVSVPGAQSAPMPALPVAQVQTPTGPLNVPSDGNKPAQFGKGAGSGGGKKAGANNSVGFITTKNGSKIKVFKG